MSTDKLPQPVVKSSIPTKKGKLSSLAPTDLTLFNDALEEFNTRYAYVRKMGRIVRIPTLTRPEIDLYPVDTFTASLERRHVAGIPIAKSWLDWTKRREVYKLAYEPGKPLITPEGNLNTWIKSPCEPKKGDVSLFLDYLDRVFKTDPTYRDWFLAWLAYPIQNPGAKLHTACIFWSTQTGTGKSMLGIIMRQVYGLTNSAVIKEAELHSQWNHWADGRQFIMIEEVKGMNAEKHADALKALITQQTVFINKKNLGQYELRDCTNYYFNSNHAEALFLDEHDRRFFVHNLGSDKYPEEKWRNEFEPWANAGGYAAIHHYLKHEVDLAKPIIGGRPFTTTPYPFSPGASAPQTEARREMIVNSKSDAQQWIEDLIEWAPNVLYGNKWKLATSEELWKLFQKANPRTPMRRKTFVTALRSKLKPVYADNRLLLSSGTKVKLYPTSNEDKWDGHDEIVSAYEAEDHDTSG